MATSRTLELVANLRGKGVELAVRKGKLCARPPRALTPEIRAELDQRRADILKLLTEAAPPTPRSQLAPSRVETLHAGVNDSALNDRPRCGCYVCGCREFARVRSGPMWICSLCHPPQFERDIVERMTAPEPS